MRLSIFAAVLSVMATTDVLAVFEGNLDFSPKGCEEKRECYLVDDFAYIDPENVRWLAKKGDKTDGASIPTWAQRYVGQPFEPMFIKAAVIHDHYCDRHVRPMVQTHRAFYFALKESGVSEIKASIMYYAVRVGATAWFEVKPGISCGKNCIFSIEEFLLDRGTSLIDGMEGKKLAVRNARFDDPLIQADIDEIAKKIEAEKIISLDELDALALKRHPFDRFLHQGNAILMIKPIDIFQVK